MYHNSKKIKLSAKGRKQYVYACSVEFIKSLESLSLEEGFVLVEFFGSTANGYLKE